MKIKTLYIDVYFLINFTVDLLSLYFAARFSKIPTTIKRLIIASLFGALSAVGIVFLPENTLLKFVAAALGLLLIGFIAPKKITLPRKIKYIFAFLIFEALVGGAVTFIWGLLDRYISDFFNGFEGGAVNRKMLFLSLIVLLSIGVFKMLVSLFTNVETEESVDLEIRFLNKTAIVSAFVDSGNLAVDPMDMTPVLLIKKEIAEGILPVNIDQICDIDSLDRQIKKRIRLIPISRGGETYVLVGVKVDSVKIIKGDFAEEIAVTLAIDKEGGTYGGYKALMPSAALENAIR